MRIKGIIITATALLLLLAAACERKDLYDEVTTLEVSMHDAEGGIPGGEIYRGLVYDRITGLRTGYAFIPPGGGELPVPAGRTGLVVHTFGCETCFLDGEDRWDDACVTTNRADAATQGAWLEALSLGLPLNDPDADSASVARRRAALAPLHVSWEPDDMWAAVVDGIDVPLRADGETFSVDAVARPVAEELPLRLTGVVGMAYVASVRVFLTGAAPARMLGSWEPTGSPVVVASPLYRDGADLVCRVRHFGVAPSSELHAFVVVTDTGGGLLPYEYDLSGRVPDATGWLRLPSGMEVSEPKGGAAGGFAPTIEDWQTKVVPVQL